MFDNLAARLQQTFRSLRGKSHLTQENIQQALREVRTSLLEADVALPVVKGFLAEVEQAAIGQAVAASLEPGQALLKIVKQQLTELMGGDTAEMNLQVAPPAIILVAGLQGSGKTTTVAKLARWLVTQRQKRVLLVSTDIYRPAAIDQLRTLAAQVEVSFCPSSATERPVAIAQNAIQQAKREQAEVVIIDTAGRLHVDETMMAEIRELHHRIQPHETLFVVDSMTGQDAANTARSFHQALPLSGVILTKTDGDARGGAALSIRYLTGKPIQFIGTGEKLDALQPFHPERIASRILGMGDMLSLIEEAQQKIDEKKAKKMANKLKQGGGFNLADFRDQLEQMQAMGGMSSIMSKLPGLGNLPQAALGKLDGQQFNKFRDIINSMTPQEREFYKLVNQSSRKKRIARGSGTTPQDITKLLNQFGKMQKMMKKFGKPGSLKKLMNKLPGGLPDDFKL